MKLVLDTNHNLPSKPVPRQRKREALLLKETREERQRKYFHKSLLKIQRIQALYRLKNRGEQVKDNRLYIYHLHL